MGRLTTPNALLTFNRWSRRTGKLMLWALTNGLTMFAPNISLEIASNTKFLSLNLSYKASKEGISILQGPHHVAQKFTSICLPRNWFKLISFPSKFFKVKLGALSPSLTCAAAETENRIERTKILKSLRNLCWIRIFTDCLYGQRSAG